MTIKYRFKTWKNLQYEKPSFEEYLFITVLKETKYNAYMAYKKSHKRIPGFTPDNIEEIDTAADYLFKGYHVCNWNKNGVCYIEYEEDEKND